MPLAGPDIFCCRSPCDGGVTPDVCPDLATGFGEPHFTQKLPVLALPQAHVHSVRGPVGETGAGLVCAAVFLGTPTTVAVPAFSAGGLLFLGGITTVPPEGLPLLGGSGAALFTGPGAFCCRMPCGEGLTPDACLGLAAGCGAPQFGQNFPVLTLPQVHVHSVRGPVGETGAGLVCTTVFLGTPTTVAALVFSAGGLLLLGGITTVPLAGAGLFCCRAPCGGGVAPGVCLDLATGFGAPHFTQKFPVLLIPQVQTHVSL